HAERGALPPRRASGLRSRCAGGPAARRARHRLAAPTLLALPALQRRAGARTRQPAAAAGVTACVALSALPPALLGGHARAADAGAAACLAGSVTGSGRRAAGSPRPDAG